MARNYKELQAKMNPASIADNRVRVREELQRMALEELRCAKQLTQADIAEMLDVPQSSVSRIGQRADMYLSTLRNFIQAMGGVLQIRAIFPDVGTVVINRFGDDEERPYEVLVRTEGNGTYRLRAVPCSVPGHNGGELLSTRALRVSGLVKVMKALHLPEPQIVAVRENLENAPEAKLGIARGVEGNRVFSVQDLVAAGFEAEASE